ncbi:MAG: PDZ domain-containing protein [Planctomycetaceae bacterium]|nr:PDZ domain-containing protein [Planctomycetaceae bacterium]
MKRFALSAIVLAMAAFAGMNAQADEKKMTEQEVAALEASLFASMETLDTSSDAKFAEQLEASEGNDGAAKCWFWCWRRRWVTYPHYYYQTWYCPTYYVPFRIVTYSVPVVRTVVTTPVVTTPVVTTPVVTTPVAQQPVIQTATPATNTVTTTATATATATAGVVTKFLPTSQKVARGAVIDAKVPDNSPLAKIGLRAGDIITKVDGNPVNAMIDIRRITPDSTIEFVRGSQIKVAGKQILQNGTAQNMNGAKSADVTVSQLQSLQETEMTLYEYYDNMEKETTMK